MLSYLPATVISLLGHGLLVFLLLIGWNFSDPPEPVKPPNYIKAKLVDYKPQAKPSAPKEVPEPPKIDLEKKRQEQERIKQQQAAEAEAARQKQIALEKEQAKKEKERLEKEKQQKLAKQREEEERKRQQEELKRQMELEQQALAKEQLEQSLTAERKRLEAERKAEELAQQAEADEELTQSYTMLIQQRITQNWSRPPSARNDMKALIQIQMVPTGEIIDVIIKESSGNAAYDRSAVQAVKKTRQIPEIREMPSRVFERDFRQITFIFNPQDLRQ